MKNGPRVSIFNFSIFILLTFLSNSALSATFTLESLYSESYASLHLNYDDNGVKKDLYDSSFGQQDAWAEIDEEGTLYNYNDITQLNDVRRGVDSDGVIGSSISTRGWNYMTFNWDEDGPGTDYIEPYAYTTSNYNFTVTSDFGETGPIDGFFSFGSRNKFIELFLTDESGNVLIEYNSTNIPPGDDFYPLSLILGETYSFEMNYYFPQERLYSKKGLVILPKPKETAKRDIEESKETSPKAVQPAALAKTEPPPIEKEQIKPPPIKRVVAKKEAEKNTIYRESWLLDQDSSYYTLQVLGVRNEELLLDFINRHQLLKNKNVAYYKTAYKGKQWYPLLSGVYPTKSEAAAAVNELPDKVQKAIPWIRKLSTVQNEVRTEAKQRGRRI